MSKPARIWVLVVGVIVVLLVFPAASSHAWSHHGGGRVFVGVGVIVQQPQIYIQHPPALQAAATYWYYCPSAKKYYPEVQSCAEPWIPVPPRNP